MRYDPYWVNRILLGLTLFFFGIALLGLVGELLGWWNLVGEILMAAGTFGGFVLGAATLSQGASRNQVDTVDEKLGSMDGTLGSMDDQLDSVDSKLDQLDSMDSKLDQLDSMDTTLDEIRDALQGEEGMTHELDAIQVQLDQQTGVLDRQVRVLEQIRDQGSRP